MSDTPVTPPPAVTSETVEHVLCVPTLLFHELGYFEGFQANTRPYLGTLLDPAYTGYRPRNEVEEDPSYKQLIPYCLFAHEGEVFFYRRGRSSGEGRLHAKRSIGIGGHVSSDDSTAGSAYDEGMRREIEEEVHLDAGWTQTCIGLINDDATPVGRVHLGIVHLFELDSPQVRPREASIIETGFARPEQLHQDAESFESWSRICLEHLIAQRH